MQSNARNKTSRMPLPRLRFLAAAFVCAALFSAATSVSTAVSFGNECGCGQPSGIGIAPTASDALLVLNTALGNAFCDTCHCDVDASGLVTATDALKVLLAAVGAPVEMTCSECQVPGTCGDGVVEGCEVCDDANGSSNDACYNDCTENVCGDGAIDFTEEQCDNGAANDDEAADACRSDCSLAHCGDGVLDTGEGCEPAGTASCTLSCEIPTGRNLPAGFQDTVVLSGMYRPTSVVFAPAADGRIFVATQPGKVHIFNGFEDTVADVVDLSAKVHFHGDRGLNGMALHPDFPTEPYIYLVYVLDAPVGMEPPVFNDSCPDTTIGCAVGGRLSRFRVNADNTFGPEQVFVEDWCVTARWHTMGDIVFGNDGALYVSAGDGASAAIVDYGQTGDPDCTDTTGVACTPINICGDPGSIPGQAPVSPTSEAGAFRAQDLMSSGDPVGLGGTVLRLDPATGMPMADNPLVQNSEPGDDAIIAFGLRNPFRMAFQPGTDRLYVGDVGWFTYEEIDLIENTNDAEVENFGWPCYEGAARQAGFAAAGFHICDTLYADPSLTEPPVYAYGHTEKIASDDLCGTGSSAVSAMGFYAGGGYPDEYDNVLVFGDYARGCIWTMTPDAQGNPDPATRETFVYGAGTPVDIERGPEGDLFYVDVLGGSVRRIHYAGADLPPIPALFADKSVGLAPLLVNFDAADSRDPEGGPLSCTWDLDGDGVFEDSSLEAPSYTYSTAGTYVAGVEVIDEGGNTAREFIAITVGDSAPAVQIITPGDADWSVGEEFTFSGSAADAEDGVLDPAAMSWELILHHCPSNCHTHIAETFQGVAGGTFTTPDHEYPSFLELKLTAVDSAGLSASASVFLQPRTVALEVHSEPQGMLVATGDVVEAAPVAVLVIDGSTNSIAAPVEQESGSSVYQFSSWSDGGSASHDITAGPSMAPFTATYTTQ